MGRGPLCSQDGNVSNFVERKVVKTSAVLYICKYLMKNHDNHSEYRDSTRVSQDTSARTYLTLISLFGKICYLLFNLLNMFVLLYLANSTGCTAGRDDLSRKQYD
jgi:hypothetical protein